jgi:hypothetical protein
VEPELGLAEMELVVAQELEVLENQFLPLMLGHQVHYQIQAEVLQLQYKVIQ